MNGVKCGSVRIDVCWPPSTAVAPELVKKSAGSDQSQSKWVLDVWKFAKEDTNRVMFAFKVGLAILLASLLVLIREPYELFGATNIIWAILTVAIMFEYTVGATFNKGFNRAVGTLSAGILALVVIQVAMSCGHVAEPCIIGFSIFFVGYINMFGFPLRFDSFTSHPAALFPQAVTTSFMRLWPSLSQYEYGFRVTLFTYCMIIISSYRMGSPVRTAVDRLYSIAIGGTIAVLVNALVFPVWVSEQLHNELAKSFTTVANALQECIDKYLREDWSDDDVEFSKTVMDDFPDEPAFKKCRATMNSSSKLDSLANSAKWEPPHGKFRHFFYPWPKYVKVGAVLRHCAYEVMALHGCLHSEIQAPYSLRTTFRSEILDATTQAAELLHTLGTDITNMRCNPSHTLTLLKSVHSSTERLQRSIDLHSYLLTSTQHPVKLSTTLSFNPKEEAPLQAESYQEAGSVKKSQHRRLYSWPSRVVDDEFVEDRGNGGDRTDGLIPRMQALESTAAMSLATFTSLLIEFVARIDHLVDAVDELAKMAKFRDEGKG